MVAGSPAAPSPPTCTSSSPSSNGPFQSIARPRSRPNESADDIIGVSQGSQESFLRPIISPPPTPLPLPTDVLLQILDDAVSLEPKHRYRVLKRLALVSRGWKEGAYVKLYNAVSLEGHIEVAKFVACAPERRIRRLRLASGKDRPGLRRACDGDAMGVIRRCDGLRSLDVVGLWSLSPQFFSMEQVRDLVSLTIRDSPIWCGPTNQLLHLQVLSIDLKSCISLSRLVEFLNSIPSNLATLSISTNADIDDVLGPDPRLVPPPALPHLTKFTFHSTSAELDIPSRLLDGCPFLSHVSFTGSIPFSKVLSILRHLPKSVTLGSPVFSPWMNDEGDDETTPASRSTTTLRTLALESHMLDQPPINLLTLLDLPSLSSVVRIEVSGRCEHEKERRGPGMREEWDARWKAFQRVCEERSITVGVVR